MLVQIHEHILLESGLPVVDANAVVMSVETVDECLDGRFVQVTQVGCALSRFLTQHERLGIDESEGIDHNLAFHRLDGVNDNGDGSRCELFEGLLSIDINRGQPAAETRMRVIPAYYSLGSEEQLVSVSYGRIT